MLAERQTGRAAAREGHALHLEKGNNVLVERAVVLELVGEIENDVRREGSPAFAAADRDRRRWRDARSCGRASPSAVSTFASVFQSSVFSSALKILVDRRRTPSPSKQREDFEFRFHGVIWCA